MHRTGPVSLCVALWCGASACSSTADEPDLADDAVPVVARYVQQVRFAYGEALTGAQTLQTAIDAFVASPDATTHQAAKDAWLAARMPYGMTEAFRFYDGPIDNAETGPEGRINAWPMDEAYVDYVEGMPDAGIINDPMTTIDAATLAGLNEVGGETNIATGWHAIEFLLWGQDLAADGPGARSHTDFVDGGPIANADRRRQYLTVVGAMLVEDLQMVTSAWQLESAYVGELTEVAVEDVLAKMMRGIGALAGGELSGERMNVAYDTKEQEDEHSCFSDNTHNDILANFLGIEHVYFADFDGEGASIDDLIEARDPELAATVRQRFVDVRAAIDAIPAPFDQAIQGTDTAPGRAAIAEAVEGLRALSDDIVAVADVFGIGLSVEI